MRRAISLIVKQNYRSSSPLILDVDALAVINAITATGVTLSNTQINAINNRIVAAKADGAWAKWVAYYGFVGGTANSHAINWKNPSAYLMTWNGTLTHDANGVKGDGASGYGNTGITPSVALSIANCGLGFYLTEPKASSASWDCGAAIFGSNNLDLAIYLGAAYTDIGVSSLNVANSGAKQYLSTNSTNVSGSTTAYIYSNGVQSSPTAISGTLPSSNIFLCAYSVNGVANTPSIARFGSFSVNTGLTDVEETANYISELAFQTALGRN